MMAQVAGCTHDMTGLIDHHATGNLFILSGQPLLLLADLLLAPGLAGSRTGCTTDQEELFELSQGLNKFVERF